MINLNQELEDFDAYFFKRHGELPLDSTSEEYANKSYLKHEMFKAWKARAKAQTVPEGYVVVPKGVLDLTRFMCKTWAEIDNFVYKNCTNLGEYPVIQGTSNQFNLAKIGNQKVDNKAIPSAVKWFLESESGAEG
ncbi:hypothetical protein [Acinetobacter baumannii]|uniref:hypothetical protein n=1 Tax=Acinetobacter baumannii TaxID=470 RepID=UPI000447F283|nr:hypothetical protein [Acinetobacter baumannii]EXR46253.1 hypothetical protein J661_2882 [Acinetobacter baumannii 1391434]